MPVSTATVFEPANRLIAKAQVASSNISATNNPCTLPENLLRKYPENVNPSGSLFLIRLAK